MVTHAERVARARKLRLNPTGWEIGVRRCISNARIGHKFRRPHVIFPCICDFFCAAKGLIAEIDGATHDADADRRRDALLAAKGVATIRFSNLNVRDSLEGVIAAINNALTVRPDRWQRLPHPNPSPKGAGLSS